MKLKGVNLKYFESSSEDINADADMEFLDQAKDNLEFFQFLSDEEKSFVKTLPNVESKKLYFNLIVDRIKNQKELMVDDMTGMFRREMMYRYLELKLGKKSNEEILKMPISIAAADFAYLGYFNLISHDAGDVALSKAAESMKDEMKEAGAVSFRMGGDEFAFVIPRDLQKSANLTISVQKKLDQIDTSNPNVMGGHKFEMPFWVDFGTAALSEGLGVWEKYCNESDSKKYCAEEDRVNQVIDFTHKIADGRSIIKKHHSLVKRLVDKFEKARETNSLEQFDTFFKYSTLKKGVTREDVEKIANVQDVIQKSKRINEFAQSLKRKEDEDKVNEERMKIKAIDSYIVENINSLFE